MIAEAVVSLGVGVAAYFDIFKERNIPNWVLYPTLGASLILTDPGKALETAAITATLIPALYFLCVKKKTMGEADLWIYASIAIALNILVLPTIIIANLAFLIVNRGSKEARAFIPYIYLGLCTAILLHVFGAPF